MPDTQDDKPGAGAGRDKGLFSLRTFRQGLWHQRAATRLPDLGHEPALSITGADHAPRDKLQISLRWLSGTVITALAGTTLMGGALLAAVEGTTRFAIDPSLADLRDVISQGLGPPSSRKGDRLPPRIDVAHTRRLVQIATATRQGDREIVKTKPFARITAPLVLQRAAITASIPPFNPTQIFAEAGKPIPFIPAPADDGDAEMVVSGRPINEAIGAFSDEDQYSDAQVHSLVQHTLLTANAANANPFASLDKRQPGENVFSPNPLLALRGSDGREAGGDDQARIVPQNITQVEKRPSDGTSAATSAAPAAPNDEIIHAVRAGDSLASILVQYGASLQESRQIIDQIAKNFRVSDLKEGERVRITSAAADATGQHKTPTRVAIVTDRRVLAAAALTDLGQYAALSLSLEALDETPSAKDEEEEEPDTSTTANAPTLFESIYQTALSNQIPRELVDELIRVYAYDVDFQRRVKPGDSIDVFYSAEEKTGGAPTRDDILYTALTVNGETKRYFKFRAPGESIVDFYDERGRSSKKFLLRTPINGAVLRSGYGFRRHPILGFSRLHTGVDWAARFGSPVASAGNGIVQKAEWTSGYGRRVEVQHANGYVTTYNHLSAFARNVQKGSRVTQGQIVGFLGSSGLSTGPHLHYEVIVNGSFVDPLRIRVPRGRVLDGRVLSEFDQQRDNVEQMMRKTGPAQLARLGN